MLVQAILGPSLGQMALAALLAVGGLGLALEQDWRLTLVNLAALPLQVLAMLMILLAGKHSESAKAKNKVAFGIFSATERGCRN